MAEYRDFGRAQCERCGRPVVDDSFDFGNGLMLRSVCGGIDFRVVRRQGVDEDHPGQNWTFGMTRAELLHFLGVVEIQA